MKATLLYAAGDVRVEDVPDARIQQPTDAVVRVVASCVCGSDLWPYKSAPATDHPRHMGHEFLGTVEELGSEVTGLAVGDLVVAPFVWADGTCEYCRSGLPTSCLHGGQWGLNGVDGGQGEAVRVPFAAANLVKLPDGTAPDSALVPDLLTLSDVLCTGYHAAHTAGVQKGESVAVIGDGAVGLSGVIAAKLLGAEQIILLGRHTQRTDLGSEFGATDVVAERGEEGETRVRELTGGLGAHRVLECVGTEQALTTAYATVRDGGAIGRVGVPQYAQGPIGMNMIMRNITLTGGVAPARAYIEQLLPHILSGEIHPGKVFDRTVTLDEVPDAYRAMNDREALKVLIQP
ncbi:zinc-dependent alcohol dehydrogenase family protein [Streptomyces sp. NPDC056002]|uniref:zinc-dependent alcohol dehydrogenase family protein n=1 Tax=Streptomyces sp. NPDC056002 TaxID=3345675 RepID=UPI0035E07DFE